MKEESAAYGTALDRAVDRERASRFFAVGAAVSGIFAVANLATGGPDAWQSRVVLPHAALAVAFVGGHYWARRSSTQRARIQIIDGVTYGLASALVGVMAASEGGLTATVVHLLPCLTIAQGITLRDPRGRRAVRLALSGAAFALGYVLAHEVIGGSRSLHPGAGDWLSDLLDTMIYQVLATIVVLGAATVSDAQPRSVGRYLLEKRIGDGGMAEVWLGHGPASPHEVAIKVTRVKKVGPQMIMRFGREIAALAELRHPSTVRILDWGVADGELYYVMELLRGETLHALVRREGPLRPERALHIVREIARVMIEAHGLGIVHRDIKPENVFILPGDGVKLLDFGIAKTPMAVDDEEDSDITRAGTAIGTPPYMAPEQILAEPVDARTDVYALGATLFFALTGRPPFLGAAAQVFRAHLHSEIPDPVAHSPHSISPGLRSVVLRCLQKNAARRFATMVLVDLALTALLEGDTDHESLRVPVSERPAPKLHRRRRRSLRRRSASSASARVSDAPPTTRPDRAKGAPTVSEMPRTSLRALALGSLPPPASGRVSIRPSAPPEDLPDTLR